MPDALVHAASDVTCCIR